MIDKSKEDIQKNTIKCVWCYAPDTDSKETEEVRAYFKRVGIDITEIDTPDDTPPNKKIPHFSFMVPMDKAERILDILNERFSENPYLWHRLRPL